MILFLFVVALTVSFQVETHKPAGFHCDRDPACGQHRPKIPKHKPIHPRDKR